MKQSAEHDRIQNLKKINNIVIITFIFISFQVFIGNIAQVTGCMKMHIATILVMTQPMELVHKKSAKPWEGI